MASLESTWELRCKSAPRSIAVYTAPSIPIPSLSSSRSSGGGISAISSNPFESHSSAGYSSIDTNLSTNPFDAASQREALAGQQLPQHQQQHNRKQNNDPSATTAEYAVMIGTERGSLHYRTFPSPYSLTSRDLGASDGAYYNRNSMTIDPLGMGGGGSISGIHPLYQPLDSSDSGTNSWNQTIVACVRASYSSNLNTLVSTPFLLLRDDHRDGASSGSSSSVDNSQNNGEVAGGQGGVIKRGDGAYVASLIALNHSNRTVSNLVQTNDLPRMSCVAFHCKCGFVYASGTSVMSLSPVVVRKIAAASFSGGGVSKVLKFPNQRAIASANRGMHFPTVYYEARNVLPSRLSEARSGMESSMTVICDGLAIVVAVGNGFYCVSGALCPDGLWLANDGKGNTEEGSVEVTGMERRQQTSSGGYEDEHYYLNRKLESKTKKHVVEKVLSFAQSSQVHPSIVVDVPISPVINKNLGNTKGGSNADESGTLYGVKDESISSLIFLASGRECAVVEISYHSQNCTLGGMAGRLISVGQPRHGIATLASPILAAVGLIPSSQAFSPNGRRGLGHAVSSHASSTLEQQEPLVAVLTSDGLVHTRSPSCISIPLSTIEVGTRPNDFFTLRALPQKQVFAGSYSGEGRLITFRSDTIQDMADRLMKLSIDAFSANGFPRSELADAVNASFSATSYVGPEPTTKARNMLRQYLETVLRLDTVDFVGCCGTVCFSLLDDVYSGNQAFANQDNEVISRQPRRQRILGSSETSTFLSSTALLCLVCTHLSPPNVTLANKAAKSCATKMGVVGHFQQSGMKASSVQVCELIAERLLQEAETTNRTLLMNVASPNPIQSSQMVSHKGGIRMEMVEAAVWLLRSCGQHERAITVLQERLENPSIRNKIVGGIDGAALNLPASGPESSPRSTVASPGGWTQIKYDSHTAAHLAELWSVGDDSCSNLVLSSTATRKLLERNAVLGLSIFTTPHPQNEEQWATIELGSDPLATPVFPFKVIELLKSVCPIVSYNNYTKGMKNMPSNLSEISKERTGDGSRDLPLESGRALAVTYLESAFGISSGRRSLSTVDSYPSVSPDDPFEERVSELHDELAYLLLEGVISECSDDEAEVDSALGDLYRGKLRRLLSWPNAKFKSERLMVSLPSSFLRERALLLGRLGQHEDALRIFYFDLNSLEFALEYCDARFERQQTELKYAKKANNSKVEKDSSIQGTSIIQKDVGCAYLPLVSVALESDKDSERGIAAAIQVLSLRRESIDRASALRLLPRNVPMSTISRPFLIPALIDSESQVRRLKIAASLLRAKYINLKHSLTDAQIKSQSMLHAVPALRSLNLSDPVYTSKPFKARPSNMGISLFPDVTIYKHFFARYVIIQAKVTNSAPALDGRTLVEVSLVVAESSDEALLPSINVPIKTLPPRATGSSWCVLTAFPQRLDGTAILACEVRYTVLAVDSVTGAPLSFSSGFASVGSGRTFVEEVQDIEVNHAEFNI